MEIKITQKRKLLEVNNDMTHNFYYEIKGRIYNDDETKYKKFNFVLWFDIFDILEYFEKEYFTQEDLKTYLAELSYSYVDIINSYEDTKDFYNFCYKSIDNYNRIATNY